MRTVDAVPCLAWVALLVLASVIHGHADDERDIEEILAELTAPDASVRGTAVDSLRERSAWDCVAEVRPLLAEHHFLARRAAVCFLAEADDAESWDKVSRMARDKNRRVRYAVARVLSDYGPREEAIPVLVGLLSEYMPLTENQWRRQTPQQRAKWKQVEQIARNFERLEKLGEAGRYSPEWIDVILRAGRNRELIQPRPSTREAVAPYVTPSTPETRSLSADEASETLRRDWLHQAGNRPTAERICSEIGWARRLAERIEATGRPQVDLSGELAQLDALEKDAKDSSCGSN